MKAKSRTVSGAPGAGISSRRHRPRASVAQIPATGLGTLSASIRSHVIRLT